MVNTFFIGHSFLSRPLADFWFDYYTFYGANYLSGSTWQINFCKERRCYTSIDAKISSPFCVNVDVGGSLRFADVSIYIEKDGSMSLRGNQFGDLYKGQRKVNSLRFNQIGQDFITVEYELTK